MSKSISSQLKKSHLKKIKIRGDGNCQFRALECVLKENNIPYNQSQSIDHRSLRKLAVKLLTRRRRHYEDFIYGRTFAQYIKAMKHSEYGDNLTLQVLADHFDLRVVILRDERRRNIINQSGNNTVTLIYTGDDGYDAHYDAAAPCSTKRRGSTKRSKSRKSRKRSKSRKSRKRSKRRTTKSRKSRKSRKRSKRIRKVRTKPRRKSRRSPRRRVRRSYRMDLDELEPEPRRILRRDIDSPVAGQPQRVIPIHEDPMIRDNTAIRYLNDFMIKPDFSLIGLVSELLETHGSRVYIEGSFVTWLYSRAMGLETIVRIGDIDLHAEFPFIGGYGRALAIAAGHPEATENHQIGIPTAFGIKLDFPLINKDELGVDWKNPGNNLPIELSIVGGLLANSFAVQNIPKVIFTRGNTGVISATFSNIEDPYNSIDHNEELWTSGEMLFETLYRKYKQALELYLRYNDGPYQRIPAAITNLFVEQGKDFTVDFNAYVVEKQGEGPVADRIRANFAQIL